MRLRGGCVKTPPCVAAAVVCGAKRGAEIGVGIAFVVSETERWLVVVAPRVGVGRGGVSGWTGGGGDRRGGDDEGRKASVRARVNEATRARRIRARMFRPSRELRPKGKASNSVTGIPVKRTSSSAWRGPCGTECRWARPSRKSPSGGAKEFPLLATPRQEWSAPSHRSRSPAAPDPSVRVGTLGREKATLATAIRLTGVSEQRGERAGDRHGRERDRRRQRGLISLFLQTAGRRRIETHHAQRRQGPVRVSPSPPLPTVAHHHSVFRFRSCRLRRVARAARASWRTRGTEVGVREILTRKPFESPDVANLRRASSGRSPLRCGGVVESDASGNLVSRRASGLQRSDWLRLSRQEVLCEPLTRTMIRVEIHPAFSRLCVIASVKRPALERGAFG